jgi:hypothetical protein
VRITALFLFLFVFGLSTVIFLEKMELMPILSSEVSGQLDKLYAWSSTHLPQGSSSTSNPSSPPTETTCHLPPSATATPGPTRTGSGRSVRPIAKSVSHARRGAARNHKRD